MFELIAAITAAALLLAVLTSASIRRRRAVIDACANEPEAISWPAWGSGRRRRARAARAPSVGPLFATSSPEARATAERAPDGDVNEPTGDVDQRAAAVPADSGAVNPRLRHAGRISTARPTTAGTSARATQPRAAGTAMPTATTATPTPVGRHLLRRLVPRWCTAGPSPTQSDQLTQRVGARHATIDILVQVVGRTGNLMLGVAVTLVLVHSLGARGFGQWSTILAITQIAINFGDLGLNQVSIARAVAEPDREREWLGALVTLRLALAVPMTIGTLVGVLIVVGGHARVAGVIMAVPMLVGAMGSMSAVFQLRVRNDVSTAILTFQSVVWLIGVIIVAAAGGDIRAFAIAFVLTNALMTVLNVTLGLHWLRPQLAQAWRLWRPLLRVGLGVGAAGILVTVYVRLDQILVFEFAGSRQAGLYGAAYRILDQAQFIPVSVMTTLFPLIASSYVTDKARVRRLVQLTAEYLSMGSFGALAFTIVAAQPIMVLLFGAQFAPAAPALPILMGAFVSISFGYLVGNMVVILELQRRFLLYAALALMLNVVLNVLLIPRYGFEAAAWVTLATEVTVMSLSARSVQKRLDMSPNWARLGRVAAAAGGMGLTVEAAHQAGVPLAFLVAIAAVVYPAFLLASRALTPSNLAALIRRDPIA